MRTGRGDKSRLCSGLAALVVIAVALAGCRPLEWVLVKRTLRGKFRDVDWITTQQLAEWLADTKRTAPVLLDVRTLAEWNVSHLPRARRVDPKATAQEAAGELPKDARIVAYCSVGYRSGLLARRLRSAGFTHVQDLEGSIFQWANEGRPLVQDGHAARQVHPYSASWGKLLRPELRAPLAASR
jgi:rhodanese-related sulfurtransferase